MSLEEARAYTRQRADRRSAFAGNPVVHGTSPEAPRLTLSGHGPTAKFRTIQIRPNDLPAALGHIGRHAGRAVGFTARDEFAVTHKAAFSAPIW